MKKIFMNYYDLLMDFLVAICIKYLNISLAFVSQKAPKERDLFKISTFSSTFFFPPPQERKCESDQICSKKIAGLVNGVLEMKVPAHWERLSMMFAQS